MNTAVFEELPVGSKFNILGNPTHGSTTLEKIEPIQYKTIEGDLEGVFYTAKWVDGLQAGKMCVIPTGTKKDPIKVIEIQN